MARRLLGSWEVLVRRFATAAPPTAGTPAAPLAAEGAATTAVKSVVAVPPLPKAVWSADSVRTGVLVKKLGMTQTWSEWGERVPVTVLQMVDNHVVGVRTLEDHGYVALQIGAVDHDKPFKVSKPQLGQFEQAGVPPKRHVREFKVTQDALLPVGTPLNVAHFVPGQYVDVIGKTIGKGFQGGMKRHGFRGGPASHGNTKHHRTPGSIGAGGDPARVFPGKRMAGHMGNIDRWQLCLQVYKIDTRWNVIYVRGCVPGHRGSLLGMIDAKRRALATPPPFPTAPPPAAPVVQTAPKGKDNPLDKLLHPQDAD